MSQGRILIVDDQKDLLSVLGSRLQSAGYEVLTAADGAAALLAYDLERPDILLIDVHMPEIDGLTVLREIRELDPAATIVVMSADVREERAKLALEEGACDFIPKPLDFDCLENSLLAAMIARAKRVRELAPSP
ncbi:MAG: response regulator [Elusimicrobia bacterium]|nr:response regulator [Elusimicrobiota bacterium]